MDARPTVVAESSENVMSRNLYMVHCKKTRATSVRTKVTKLRGDWVPQPVFVLTTAASSTQYTYIHHTSTGRGSSGAEARSERQRRRLAPRLPAGPVRPSARHSGWLAERIQSIHPRRGGSSKNDEQRRGKRSHSWLRFQTPETAVASR